jgi:hypothetical protein
MLSSVYLARLDLSRLPAVAAAAARRSIFAAVAVAQQLHSSDLLDSARSAFVHGMDLALLASGCAAVLGAVLAAIFLPMWNVTEPVKEPKAGKQLAVLPGL